MFTHTVSKLSSQCQRKSALRSSIAPVSHDWPAGRTRETFSPSSAPRQLCACFPITDSRCRHDDAVRRTASSAVATSPALDHGIVDPDHDRQWLAHLQCKPDLRFYHLPGVDD